MTRVGFDRNHRKRAASFPKKEYITENLPTGCRGRIILFQTDAIVGVLSSLGTGWKRIWGRAEKSDIAATDLHHGNPKQTQLR